MKPEIELNLLIHIFGLQLFNQLCDFFLRLDFENEYALSPCPLLDGVNLECDFGLCRLVELSHVSLALDLLLLLFLFLLSATACHLVIHQLIFKGCRLLVLLLVDKGGLRQEHLWLLNMRLGRLLIERERGLGWSLVRGENSSHLILYCWQMMVNQGLTHI